MTVMCRAAVDAGIDEIGFSEHYDSHPADECTGFFRVGEWWDEFQRCKSEFQDVLRLKAGLEISEPHQYPAAVNSILDAHPWDYTIGSLHWIEDEIIFDDPYFDRSPEEAYESYFLELHRMVATGRFNIIGHFDIVKRYGFQHYGAFDITAYENLIRPILKTLAERGLTLEVNTVTLRRSIQEPSPNSRVLSWFKEEGGRWISLGSDAHHATDVGANLEDAIQMIQSAGFNELVSFNSGRPSPVTISD
jgi:histidinol-phosphatase (PHP family)